MPYLAKLAGFRFVEHGYSAHNPILVIWAETGLLGILLYLGVLASALYTFVVQFLRYRKTDIHHPFLPYFALVSCVFLGYMASWFKGGSMEMAHSYFFILALLLIPAGLPFDSSLIKDETIHP
jgi:O-antigen ligase